jgi:formate hydrogenlyase subunit 3/multisubunit Na+/H+ antiporter MnhD subunit
MACSSVAFAIARGEDRHPLFHPMVAVLLAGVLGSFLTADLFNLFVAFEVMLIASYVLLTLRGGRAAGPGRADLRRPSTCSPRPCSCSASRCSTASSAP